MIFIVYNIYDISPLNLDPIGTRNTYMGYIGYIGYIPLRIRPYKSVTVCVPLTIVTVV